MTELSTIKFEFKQFEFKGFTVTVLHSSSTGDWGYKLNFPSGVFFHTAKARDKDDAVLKSKRAVNRFITKCKRAEYEKSLYRAAINALDEQYETLLTKSHSQVRIRLNRQSARYLREWLQKNFS
jgi:hypothetical protein